MNINRYNYQEYFLLYTDNELSSTERRVVEDFVRTNIDLQEELLTLQQAVFLPNEEIVFRNKELLLQFDEKENFSYPGNFEEQCISYADNELNNEERSRLERLVQTNPHLKQEFDVIASLKLTADTSIVFTGKENLYKYENEKSPIIFPWWRMTAVAILLLIGGFLWLNNQRGTTIINELSQTSGTKPVKLAPVINKKEQPVIVNTDKTGVPAKQVAKAMVILVHKKRFQSQKVTPQAASVEKNAVAYQNSFAETIDSKSFAVRTQEAEIQVKPNKKKLEDPNNNSPVLVTLNAPKQSQDKRSVERTVEIINPFNNKEYNANQSENEANENVILTNIPVDRKNSLRGIFRKATRFIDKNTGFRSSKQPSLLIGNIEIAFQ